MIALIAAPALAPVVPPNPTAARYAAALALSEALSADPEQLRANARQLHRYLTGDGACSCGRVLAVGARRCSCGRCSECGSPTCRAGRVTCEDDVEQRWQRYRARVAPLERISAVAGTVVS